LPANVAAAAVELITGPLLVNPHRIAKPFTASLPAFTALDWAENGACCSKLTRQNAPSSCWISGDARRFTEITKTRLRMLSIHDPRLVLGAIGPINLGVAVTI
jgi:hypothetical protein